METQLRTAYLIIHFVIKCTFVFFLKRNQEKMADKAVSTISKPQLRGLLNATIKKNLIISLTLAGISGFAFKQIVGNERKRKYAEFYRTYDAEKEFEIMRSKGLFQSC